MGLPAPLRQKKPIAPLLCATSSCGICARVVWISSRVKILDDIEGPGREHDGFFVKHLIGRQDFAIDGEHDCLRQTQRDERSVEKTAIPLLKGRAR